MSAQIRPLPPGTQGTNWTLVEIARLIRDDVKHLRLRDVALRIVGGCEGHDFDCEIRECLRYVQQQVTFRRDPVDLEMISGGAGTVTRGPYPAGDCDDLIILLAGLLGSLGHITRLKTGSYGEQWDHVYLEVLSRADNGWVPLDPTNKNAEVGWEAQNFASTAIYPIWPGTEGLSGLGDLCCDGCRSGKGCDSEKGLGAFLPGVFDPMSNPYGFISSTFEQGTGPYVFGEMGVQDPGTYDPITGQPYVGGWINPLPRGAPLPFQTLPGSLASAGLPPAIASYGGGSGSWESPGPESIPRQAVPFPSIPAPATSPTFASTSGPIRWGSILLTVGVVWLVFH